jgi:mono/diheme cytochrome c family protein
MRNTLGMFALGLVVMAPLPAAFGGWAVITVHDLPEYLEAGKPTTLEFTLRQHGWTPMNDRSPTVTLRKAGAGWFAKGATFTAARARGEGAYAAVVTAPDTGMVELTVDSDWGSSRVTLLPMPVVASGRQPAPLADADLGRALFVAEGCVTCHVKNDDQRLAERKSLNVGPELTGRQFPLEWITQKLTDPASLRVGTGQTAQMPNLSLSPRQIAALASYVNGAKQQATR